jgi:hypothetical protein
MGKQQWIPKRYICDRAEQIQSRKYKRLKLGGGQAYDRSSD